MPWSDILDLVLSRPTVSTFMNEMFCCSCGCCNTTAVAVLCYVSVLISKRAQTVAVTSTVWGGVASHFLCGEAFLCGVCMFSLYLSGFPPCAPLSLRNRKHLGSHALIHIAMYMKPIKYSSSSSSPKNI